MRCIALLGLVAGCVFETKPSDGPTDEDSGPPPSDPPEEPASWTVRCTEGDFQTIQEGLDAAVAWEHDGTLTLCTGRYTEALVVRRPVTLTGDPALTRLIAPEGTSDLITIAPSTAGEFTLTRLTLEGGGIRVDGTDGLVTTLVLDQLDYDAPPYALVVDGPDAAGMRVELRDLWVPSCTDGGVSITGVFDLSLLDVSFASCDGSDRSALHAVARTGGDRSRIEGEDVSLIGGTMGNREHAVRISGDVDAGITKLSIKSYSLEAPALRVGGPGDSKVVINASNITSNHNQLGGEDAGGAVVVSGQLRADSTEWGSGNTDNQPHDLITAGSGLTWDYIGAPDVFCNAASCGTLE